MRYAIWISTRSPEEAQALAAKASELAAGEFDFVIRELDGVGDPPPSTDLSFHIDSGGGADDAKAKALAAYELCRAEAALGPHEDAVVRVVVGPRLG